MRINKIKVKKKTLNLIELSNLIIFLFIITIFFKAFIFQELNSIFLGLLLLIGLFANLFTNLFELDNLKEEN